jgi:hypothetical protein
MWVKITIAYLIFHHIKTLYVAMSFATNSVQNSIVNCKIYLDYYPKILRLY